MDWVELAYKALGESNRVLRQAHETALVVMEQVGEVAEKAVEVTRAGIAKAIEIDQKYEIRKNVANFLEEKTKLGLEFLKQECTRLALALAEKSEVMQEVREQIQALRAEVRELRLANAMLLAKLDAQAEQIEERLAVHRELASLEQQVQKLVEQKQPVPIVEQKQPVPKTSSRRKTKTLELDS